MSSDQTREALYSDHVLAVLRGGALGEARALAPNPARLGQATVTTLYVLDGLLEWIEWANQGDMADPAASVWLAQLRWYRTQTGHFPAGLPQPMRRWIDQADQNTALQHTPDPDPLSLNALEDPDMGTQRIPKNAPRPTRSTTPPTSATATTNTAASGTTAVSSAALIRSAPYGMIPGLEEHMVTSLAHQGAVLTHGTEESWTASAAYALLTSQLFAGTPLPDAAQAVSEWLNNTPAAHTTAEYFTAALINTSANGSADSTHLGNGTTSASALAIALAVNLASVSEDQDGAKAESQQDDTPTGQDAKNVIDRAIQLSDDSAAVSVAALTGQMFGAIQGFQSWESYSPELSPEQDAVLAGLAQRFSAATTGEGEETDLDG